MTRRIKLRRSVAPTTPTGHVTVYAKADGTLVQREPDGTETPLADGEGGGASTAADVAFTPAGTIAATNVQDAIEEVASEAGGITVLTADITFETANLVDPSDSGALLFAIPAGSLFRVMPFVTAVWSDAEGELVVSASTAVGVPGSNVADVKMSSVPTDVANTRIEAQAWTNEESTPGAITLSMTTWAHALVGVNVYAAFYSAGGAPITGTATIKAIVIPL